MAIVKKQNNNHLKPVNVVGGFNAGQQQLQASSSQFEQSAPYNTAEYTPEALSAGMLQDRRAGLAEDRRQYFRRADDQFLLSRAELEAEQIKTQAQSEGLAQGLENSKEVIFSLKQAIEDQLSAREQALINASSEIADIALDVVKHILKAEISCDPALVDSFVRRAIKQAGHHQKMVIARVSSEDFQHLNQSFEQKPPVAQDVDLQLLEDKTVDPGSCIIETQAGQVDRRFSTQLEVLKRLVQMTKFSSSDDDAESGMQGRGF